MAELELPEEAIQFIATTHSQSVSIQLKDGTEYRGLYVHAEAGKCSDDKRLVHSVRVRV
jgi:hypothetical protein